MSNLSVFQRNVIHALDCEISASAFLRACERVNALAAEEFALEVRFLLRVISPALARASSLHGLEQVPDGLVKFILDRHWHWRFPPKRGAVA